MQKQTKHLISVAIIALGILILWWKIMLLGLTPTIEDPYYAYEDYLSVIPALHLNFEIVKSGHLPLWSPYGHAGMILFADPQFTAAYPLTWIGLLLSTHASFNAMLLLHILIASIPLYFLMLKLNARPGAALITAFIYAFSLPVSYGFLLPSRSSWQWMPLLVLLVVSYIDNGKRIPLFLLALVWCAQIPTFIQSTYNMALFLMIFSIWYCALRSRNLSEAAGRFALVILSLAIGTGLASCYLIPLFEFKDQWAYKAFSYKSATVHSFSPDYLLESFLCGCPWNSPAHWTSNLYMGVVGIVMVLYALVRSFRRRAVLFFGAAAIGMVCLSLGKFTPIYRVFYELVPGAKSFHAPMRMLWGLPFCMAVTAGLGIDHFLYKSRRGEGATGNLCFFGVLLALFGLLFMELRHGQEIICRLRISPMALRNLLIPLGIFLALAWTYMLRLLNRRWLLAGLILIMGLEASRCLSHLFFFNFDRKYESPATVRFLKEKGGLGRFFSFNEHLDCYASSFTQDDCVPMIYPELSNYFGLYDIQARGPLRIHRYDKLIKAINAEHEIVHDLGFYMAEIRNFASPIINLFGVTHIISKGELMQRHLALYENPWEMTLHKNETFSLKLDKVLTADALVLRSYLEGARSAKQGETVALLTVKHGEKTLCKYDVLAGIHTAEVFDLNNPHKMASVNHKKGDEWESWDEILWNGQKLKGSHYRGIIDISGEHAFDRLEIEYIHPSGVMRLTRIGCRPKYPEEISERFVPVLNDEEHDIIIYENKRAFPRAFLVHSVDVVRSPQEALERILDDSFDLRNRIVLEKEPPSWFKEGSLQELAGEEAKIVEYSPNRVKMTVKTQAPAFLFLSDIYYPGWDCHIDGERTTTYRADYAFRAVAVPAGEHELVMVFRPKSLMIGSFVSLASLLLLIVLIVGWRARPGKI